MRTSTLLTSFISVLLPFTAFADPHAQNQARHHAVAKRASGDVQLHKRFSNARFTYYAVGLGACGQVNQPGDFIVALNTPQYGSGSPGPQCFKQISISYGGKTTTATIMDECPGCPYGGLDMSTGLFTFFAPESEGVLYGEWDFVGGGGGDDNQPQAQQAPNTPKNSPTPKPSPTTTHTTTSTKASTTKASSSTSHKKTSSTSTSSLNLNKGPASGLAVPTGTITPGSGQGLSGINQAVIDIGGLCAAGASL